MEGGTINFIHELFEQHVIEQPNSEAIRFEKCTLTYKELNEQANQLVHFLILNGVRPGDLVGICQERSIDMIVSILAVLKAGAAYVPIDPVAPPQRIAIILRTAKPILILTHDQTETVIDALFPIINISKSDLLIKQQSVAAVEIDNSKINLAYIIFTSGTTGVPNGVCIDHSNLINLIQASLQIYDFSSKDVWCLFHSYAFDFSVWEIWGALAFGGKLVIVPYFVSRTPADFHTFLINEGVTILNQTPSAFYQLIEADKHQNKQNKLRKIILGGEAVDLSLLKPWFQKYGDNKPQIYNMYGITEVTVHATYHLLTIDDVRTNRNVIGKPLPNYQIILRDEQNNPVPIGTQGEICVLGPGVAKGYLNNKIQSQKKFVPVNTNNDSAGLMYKSGDLGCYDQEGNLEYLGRIDHQVKIRGFRIELSEIESILNQQPEINFSVVIVKNKEVEKKKLIAFVQLKNTNDNLAEKDLTNRLKQLLPAYMLPTRIKFISQIPLTVNGKIDREALLVSSK